MEPSKANIETFVGRSEEIGRLFDFIAKTSSPAFVLTGEPGIGKTSFLKEVYRRLKNDPKFIVGFHEVLFSADVANPFVGAIQSLFEQLLTTKDKAEANVALGKIRSATKNLINNKANGIINALIKDAITRLVGTHIADELEKFKAELATAPSVFSLSNRFIAEHKSEFIYSLFELLEALQEAFPNMRFVLMIDQFERAPLNSCNILLDLANRKLSNFQIIIGIKTENEGSRKLEYLKPNIERMGAEVAELRPLTLQEIGDWMDKLNLKFTPLERKKIKNLSGGFPFTIAEWIKSSKNPTIKELQEVRGKYCEFIKFRIDSLERQQNLLVRRLAVLEGPLSIVGYQQLSEIDPETCSLLLKDLEEKKLLSKQGDTFWFRHELIRFCIQRLLSSDDISYYHKKALNFFKSKLSDSTAKNEIVDFGILLGCAYHSHYAEEFHDSLTYNQLVFANSADWGLLDYAEEAAVYGIEDAEQTNNKQAELVFKSSLSLVYLVWGRIEDALNLGKEAYDLSNSVGNAEYTSRILSNLGSIEQKLGHYDEAIRLLKKSILICQQAGIPILASSIYHLSTIEIEAGNFQEGQKLLAQGLEIAKKDNDQKGIADILQAMGTVQTSIGKYDKALSLYQQVLSIRNKLHDIIGIAGTYHQIGILMDLQGDEDSALNSFDKSLEIATTIRDQSQLAHSLYHVAIILRKREAFEKALEILYRAQNIVISTGEESGLARIIMEIANVERDLGNYDESMKQVKRGLEIATRLSDKPDQAFGYSLLGSITEKGGDLVVAALRFSQSLIFYLETNNYTEAAIAQESFDRVMNKLR